MPQGPMSISEKIQAAEAALVARKDALAQVLEVDVDDEGTLTDDGALKADELTSQIEKAEADVARLKKIEASLMKSATPAEAPGAPARKEPSMVTASKPRAKGHLFSAAIACQVKAFGNRRDPVEIARDHYKDDANELSVILKAESAPATVADSAWAGALVRETYAGFMDLVRDVAVYPRLPGMNLSFDRNGSIVVPYNASTEGAMSGAFIGEGGAIPVRSGAFGQRTLAPKKMGVISSFTREIAMHSMPSIQSLIEQQIVRDTAYTLDTLFLDDQARTTVRPAGMQNDPHGAGTANINASAGATVANITADIKGVLGRVMAARVGAQGVWVMNPLRRLGLSTVQDAASGEYPFRDSVTAGTLFGYPIIVSNNVPVGVVAFIPSDTLIFANDFAPRIDVSESATLHMEDTAALPLVDGTGTVAQPVRSTFQTDTVAVRMVLGLDWIVARPNGVQIITSCAW